MLAGDVPTPSPPGLARATRPPPGFLMSVEVQYSASAAAARAIADLGRTEDVQFSPSNRRLAVAAFHHNRIAVFEVEISRSAGKPQVALNSVVEIAAETLKGPHGLCFLDEDTLVVANREGSVEVYRVPASGAATKGGAIPRRSTVPAARRANHHPGFGRGRAARRRHDRAAGVQQLT